MTYLITGVAGFVGYRTAIMLLEQGHAVVGIDNINDYYDCAIKRYRLAEVETVAGCEGSGQFRFVEGDIEDLPLLESLFDEQPFEAVINLAARAGVRYSIENPHVYFTTNTNGTLNLLEQMRHHGTKKFALASTSSLYAGLPMPFVEELPVNTPISPYAASKKAAEVLCYTYHELFGIDVSIVRYFTVFGEAGRPDMSPYRFAQWVLQGTPITLFGDGTQSRDFTHVDDVAAGTLAALKPVGYEIFNIGGGNQPVSLNTMIAWIEEDSGRQAVINREPFHKADMLSTWADISKAKQQLGWEPVISPREGFRRLVRWHRENFDWLKNINI